MKQNADKTETIEARDGHEINRVLQELQNGDIAERIMDSVRLAVSRHMFDQAREVQSAVEAENSTY